MCSLVGPPSPQESEILLGELRDAVEGWKREAQNLRSGLRAIGARVEALDNVESADAQVLLAEIKMVQKDVGSIKDESFPRVERALEKLNGSVAANTKRLGEHDTQIAVLSQFCKEQVAPVLPQIISNRVDIAVTVAKIAGGGVGVGAGLGGIFIILGKAFGWF